MGKESMVVGIKEDLASTTNKKSTLTSRSKAGMSSKSKTVVLPNALVAEVLDNSHFKSEHFGLQKTLEKITTRFWWPWYTLQATE